MKYKAIIYNNKLR